ncbi:PEP-CTERM sorting domain-containing protein [Crocosphaera watsonii]|nr:PEP-CTERM sorting domain-containing protein [Crocosphaera watsonii]
MKSTQLMKRSNNALNTLKIALISSCLIVAIPTQVKAASINILNHSFEGPEAPLAFNREFFTTNIDDWTVNSNAAVVFNPTASQNNTGLNTYFSQSLPDGLQTLAISSGDISQELAVTLQANTKYTLGVFVGRRNNVSFSGYNIELLAGNTVLASNNSITPAPGTFTKENVYYTSSDNDPLIGQSLGIRLSSDGIQTNFDNVTLEATAVPEPLTILGAVTAISFRTIFKRKVAKDKPKK